VQIEICDGGRRSTVIQWEDLQSVAIRARVHWEVVEPMIVFRRTSGEAYEVSCGRIGSDPNVVAAIVRFYLDHPEQRDALRNPVEALRRVEQAEPPTQADGGR
jgi:hypothetical protein